MPDKGRTPLEDYFFTPEILLTVKDQEDPQVKSFAAESAAPVNEISPYAMFPSEGTNKGSDFKQIEPPANAGVDRDDFTSRKSVSHTGTYDLSIDDEAELGMTRGDIGIYNSSDYDSDATGKHFFAWTGAKNYLRYVDGSSPSNEEVKYLFVTHNTLNDDNNAKDLVYGLTSLNFVDKELWQRPFAMAVQFKDELSNYYIRNSDGTSSGTDNLNISLTGEYLVTKFSIQWDASIGTAGARKLVINVWRYTQQPVPPLTHSKLYANLAAVPSATKTYNIDQSIDMVCPVVALQKKGTEAVPRHQLVAVQCLD